MNVKSFYGSIASESYLQNAIDVAEEEAEGCAHIVFTGPPQGGQDSDTEFQDDDGMKELDSVPQEVADKLDIFLNKKDNKTETTTATSGVIWKKSLIFRKPKVLLDEKKEVVKYCWKNVQILQ